MTFILLAFFKGTSCASPSPSEVGKFLLKEVGDSIHDTASFQEFPCLQWRSCLQGNQLYSRPEGMLVGMQWWGLGNVLRS